MSQMLDLAVLIQSKSHRTNVWSLNIKLGFIRYHLLCKYSVSLTRFQSGIKDLLHRVRSRFTKGLIKMILSDQGTYYKTLSISVTTHFGFHWLHL